MYPAPASVFALERGYMNTLLRRKASGVEKRKTIDLIIPINNNIHTAGLQDKL